MHASGEAPSRGAAGSPDPYCVLAEIAGSPDSDFRRLRLTVLGRFADALALLDEPFGGPAAAGRLAARVLVVIVADYGFHGLGEQGSATAMSALLPPIRDALRRAATRGVPDTVGRQWFAIGFDRACQAPAQEAL